MSAPANLARRLGAIPRAFSGILSLAILVGGLGVVAVAWAGILDTDLSAGADVSSLTRLELQDGAASWLEAATAAGGTGYTFEIIQTATNVSRPEGPLVNQPDPADPTTSLGLVESYAFSTYLESGFVTPPKRQPAKPT